MPPRAASAGSSTRRAATKCARTTSRSAPPRITMPTARELLEQADALMRRNRATRPEADIPELTDEVRGRRARCRAVARIAVPCRAPRAASSPTDDDMPELATIAVEELSIQPLPDDDGEVSRWLEGDSAKPASRARDPDSIAVVPPSTLACRPPAPHGRDRRRGLAAAGASPRRRARMLPRDGSRRAVAAERRGHARAASLRSRRRRAIRAFEAMLGTPPVPRPRSSRSSRRDRVPRAPADARDHRGRRDFAERPPPDHAELRRRPRISR